MFSFKRPKVVNQLTTLINKNPEGVTIREVLANQDLSPSIRNEVPELLDFFCPPLPTPQSAERQASSTKEYALREERQKDLALLAFTSKLNRKGETFADDECFRFNRNASNIISSPSKKFHDRLVYYYSDGNGKYTPSPFLHQLIKFAKSFKGKVSVHHQPVFYGHFHRIFEAIVRSTKGEFFEIIYKVEPSLNPFYKILIDRIYFTSIRQLYITCASEYPQQFAGSDSENSSSVYNELSKYGAKESEKIKGKKDKVLKKIYMPEKEYKEYKEKADKDKTYSLLQFDQIGFVKNVQYLKKEEAEEKKDKKKVKIENQVDGSGNIKRKKSRIDFYQNVVASLLAIRDILNDSIEVPQHLRNNDMITNILIIGKNLPESSFAVSLAYSLVLKIATSDHKSLEDYREILNKYKPNYDVDLPKLRARIEKPIHEDNQNECSGEHLIYQMPLYFLGLPKGFQDLFFSETKYSDQYDNQFVFSIKSVLTKSEQIIFFERDNNDFLKCLCKALPDPPKLNLADYKSNDDSIDPELGPVQLDENNNAPHPKRELLRGHLWDIAKYIDDEKRFKKDKLKFKSGGEWDQLHKKVVEYYKRVYAYTKEPTDEEEEEEDNPDPSE